MSTEISREMSAEEIRLRERRSFDAFNEAEAHRRQVRRDRGIAQGIYKASRRPERDVDTGDTRLVAENDSLGG
jgi:hypothetical protein